MKVVQVVTQMEAAGVQRVALLLHQALLKRGHHSEVWFLYFKRSAYSGPGVHVLWDHKPKGIEYLRLVGKLFARVRAHRPDVIIAHTYYANILGHMAGMLAGTRTRVAVQHNPIQTFPVTAGYMDRMFAELRIYTAQVAVSNAVVQSMAAYPYRLRKQVRCIHNGIEFPASGSPSPCVHLKNIPASAAKILNVGRLSVQKNHLAMLQALALLPEAHLVLVGEGEIRSEIEGQVRELGLTGRVTFIGEIPPEDVRGVMQSCDLFLFPSLWEAMPMALLEAMAAGMPIVASNIPANCEALQGAGIVIEPQASLLANSIRRLLDNPAEAAAFGAKAVARAKYFTIDAMADGYEGLFPSDGSSATTLADLNQAFSASEADGKACSAGAITTMRSPIHSTPLTSMSLIGLRLNPISDEDAVRLVGQAIQDRKRCIIANHNMHSVYLWQRDPRMRQFYSFADYIHIDGMFLILLANLLGIRLHRANRTTSLDFFPLLATKAVKENWRIFYLGSKPGVAARGATILQARYPGLQIRTHHGHFDAETPGEENQKVLAEIKAYAPHVLFVGMGMPRQEVWILENREALDVNAIFPAGAFMDYMAGEIPTAPRWLASLYLEWMFRLLSEPRRLWRRYLVEPWFVFGQIAKYCLKSGRPFEMDREHTHE